MPSNLKENTEKGACSKKKNPSAGVGGTIIDSVELKRTLKQSPEGNKVVERTIEERQVLPGITTTRVATNTHCNKNDDCAFNDNMEWFNIELNVKCDEMDMIDELLAESELRMAKLNAELEKFGILSDELNQVATITKSKSSSSLHKPPNQKLGLKLCEESGKPKVDVKCTPQLKLDSVKCQLKDCGEKHVSVKSIDKSAKKSDKRKQLDDDQCTQLLINDLLKCQQKDGGEKHVSAKSIDKPGKKADKPSTSQNNPLPQITACKLKPSDNDKCTQQLINDLLKSQSKDCGEKHISVKSMEKCSEKVDKPSTSQNTQKPKPEPLCDNSETSSSLSDEILSSDSEDECQQVSPKKTQRKNPKNSTRSLHPICKLCEKKWLKARKKKSAKKQPKKSPLFSRLENGKRLFPDISEIAAKDLTMYMAEKDAYTVFCRQYAAKQKDCTFYELPNEFDEFFYKYINGRSKCGTPRSASKNDNKSAPIEKDQKFVNLPKIKLDADFQRNVADLSLDFPDLDPDLIALLMNQRLPIWIDPLLISELITPYSMHKQLYAADVGVTAPGSIIPKAIPVQALNVVNTETLDRVEAILKSNNYNEPNEDKIVEEIKDLIIVKPKEKKDNPDASITKENYKCGIDLHPFRVETFFQLRGANVPLWYPGMFTAFPDGQSSVKLINTPSNLITTAWKLCAP